MSVPILSAILITRDEERDLPACLESLAGLDAEIIVLDSGSKDRTLEIARRHTPRVFEQDFKDYASQKQAALDRASGKWVLSIDADERLSPELRQEILRVLELPSPAAGYEIPFQVHFMGRRLRFGGLGRERHVRLFQRALGSFVGGELHEGVALRGPAAKLKGPMLHFPYRDLEDYLEKMQRYTTKAARKRFERGERFSSLHHLLPAWELFARTVLKLGFLDGTPGLVWAGLSSFHTWVKYVKLQEMERAARGENRR